MPSTVQELASDLKRVEHSHIQKVRVSGCDKSGRWARQAGTSKITPVTSALMSSHPSHIRTEREGWHRNSTLCLGVTLPLCEEALQAAERELLEKNCRTLAERRLRPLPSPPSSWTPAPRRRGTPQALLVSPPQSGANFGLARPSLRNVCAEAYWAECASDVGRGRGLWDTTYRILLAIGGRAPRDATNGLYCAPPSKKKEEKP
jgi:hypothetical protein